MKSLLLISPNLIVTTQLINSVYNIQKKLSSDMYALSDFSLILDVKFVTFTL